MMNFVKQDIVYQNQHFVFKYDELCRSVRLL